MPSETHRRLLRKHLSADDLIRLGYNVDDDQEEPPRTEEGMLIGWPEASETLREAMSTEQYHYHSMGCRNYGLDPDGPLEPMHPMEDWKDKITQADIDEMEEWDRSNAFLIRALRFT